MIQCDLNRVHERDMDLLFMQAFMTDPGFVDLVLREAELDKGTPSIVKAELSQSIGDLGETDIYFVVEIAGQRYGILIEDKVDAQAIRDFKKFMDSRIITGSDAAVNRRAFASCFLFMTQRREVFCQVCCDMALQEIIYRMMVVLYPKLKLTWHPKGVPDPVITSERVDIYFRRMVGVICWWGRTTQCDIDKADPYVWQLTARHSLVCVRGP